MSAIKFSFSVEKGLSLSNVSKNLVKFGGKKMSVVVLKCKGLCFGQTGLKINAGHQFHGKKIV